MTLSGNVDALAGRVADEFNTVRTELSNKATVDQTIRTLSFQPGDDSGGPNRRWVRLVTLDGDHEFSGAHVQFILAGASDFGAPDRATVLVHANQRGFDTVTVKGWSWGRKDTWGTVELYTKQISSFVFEIWGKFATWNQTVYMHILQAAAGGGVTWHGDSATSVEPAGMSAMWPILDFDEELDKKISNTGIQTLAGSLEVQGTGKAYKFRTNGGALDFDVAGASLYLSMFPNGDFSGDQNEALIIDTDGTVHVNGPAINVPSPTAAGNAANRQYVDDGLAGKPDLSDAFPTAVGEFNNAGTSVEASRSDHTHSWSAITPTDIGAADAVHNHDDRYYTEGEVDQGFIDVYTALDGKQAAGSYAAASHTHTTSQVTGLDTALSGKAATTHGHVIGDVTGLQTALDGKQAAGSYASATHNHDSLYEPLRSVRTVNPAAGTISIDANVNGDTIKSTLTADATLNIPTNGFEDQILQGVVLASGAQRVLTFHASFGRLGMGNTLTIPSGKVGRYALRRTDITGSAKWLVESVGVES